MVDLHANILEHEGKKAFVVIPYEEYLALEEELQEFEDLKQLRAAKVEEGGAATIPLADVRRDLGMERP